MIKDFFINGGYNMNFSSFENLSCKIAIYVPATVNIDVAIDNSDMVEKTAIFLSDLFGGCTACDVSGYWITQEKKLVKEKPVVVYAYTTEEKAREAEEKIIDFVQQMKREMMQECVSVEYNNRLYFI